MTKLGLHLVWCTKFRKAVLQNPAVALLVKNIIGQACIGNGWRCLGVEVMPEHVHLFVQVKHTDSPVNIVKTLKSLTAVAVFTAFPAIKVQKFWGCGLWSRGAYYASVGDVSQETISRYIQQQTKKGGDSSATIKVAVSSPKVL